MTSNPIIPELIVMGAGPGDPELITVKGQRILQHADVVLYDNLANKELLNLTKAGCETIYVGKQPYGKYTTQQAIHEMIAHYAFTKGSVVRLKGGDPFIFGRDTRRLFMRVAWVLKPSSSPALPACRRRGLKIYRLRTARLVKGYG